MADGFHIAFIWWDIRLYRAPTYHSVARSHLNGRARRPQGFSFLVSVERGGMVPHGHPVDPGTGMVPPEVRNFV